MASLDGGSPTVSWSPLSGVVEGGEGEDSSGPPHQQQAGAPCQQPVCWQPLPEGSSAEHAAASLKGKGAAFHGDSAFLSEQQPGACQWVASRV